MLTDVRPPKSPNTLVTFGNTKDTRDTKNKNVPVIIKFHFYGTS